MNKLSIIIIDDEPWMLSDIKSAYDWSGNGFEIVHEETDPFQAINTIKEKKPDIVIIDIEMNGLSGLSVIQACKAEQPGTVFIILSAYDNFKYAKTAISLGVFEYMLKPIDEFEVFSVMERVRDYLDIEPDNSQFFDNGFSQEGNFQNIIRYVNEHYRENITLSDLSSRFYLSKTYICDLFRKHLKTTLTEYVNDLRLKTAYNLITKNGLKSSKAADLCGYNNHSYFIKLFKRRYGITPKNIVKNIK